MWKLLEGDTFWGRCRARHGARPFHSHFMAVPSCEGGQKCTAAVSPGGRESWFHKSEPVLATYVGTWTCFPFSLPDEWRNFTWFEWVAPIWWSGFKSQLCHSQAASPRTCYVTLLSRITFLMVTKWQSSEWTYGKSLVQCLVHTKCYISACCYVCQLQFILHSKLSSRVPFFGKSSLQQTEFCFFSPLLP